MANMRLDTYSFRNFLMAQLEARPTQARIEVDDGDILRVRLRSAEKVEIYLIERSVEIEEIQTVFAENQAAGIYTLYLLWCDMTLPEHGQTFVPDPWLLTLHTIYHQKVYAYKVFGQECFIYPARLELLNPPPQRRVHFGKAVRISDLGCAVNEVRSQEIGGQWFISDFDDTPPVAGYRRTYRTTDDRLRRHFAPIQHLKPYYDRLGLPLEADRHLLRKTYRQLAREYHPDVNTSSSAHDRMLLINEAYQKIAAVLEDAALDGEA